ncbi:MAG: TonB-dependent receptor [Bernardetiaceae bacterium]|nr:TonB-dependent receptor [Bernardetiaceae bacterium]
MNGRMLTTKQKALQLNLDARIYGSYAEIGAGQEVAAAFFKAGAASGTIAKTMSAYDMKFSDAIYGPEKSGRYVCEARLLKMLKKEFRLLEERLSQSRPETNFFAFANTVEVLNFQKTNNGHGWLGLRFQANPQTSPNEFVIHVNLLDNHKFLQEQVIGILGVNMIYACYYYADKPDLLLTSLMDNLSRDRVEIDMVRITGPDFEHIDNRIMSLKLVKNGMSNAALFDTKGKVRQPSEYLYKKNILALRGRFRPVTHVNMDIFERSKELFLDDPDVDPDAVVVLAELTLKNLNAEGEGIDEQDFLDRVDILGSLGKAVMISNYQEYYRLVSYLSSLNRQRKIGLALGVYSLADIFNPRFYNELKGGFLEAYGRLFGHNVVAYVYPSSDTASGELITSENFELKSEFKYLCNYLIANNQIIDIQNFKNSILHIFSDDVLAMIRKGEDESWRDMVPKEVVKAISQKCLFGYPCSIEEQQQAELKRKKEEAKREALREARKV